MYFTVHCSRVTTWLRQSECRVQHFYNCRVQYFYNCRVQYFYNCRVQYNTVDKSVLPVGGCHLTVDLQHQDRLAQPGLKQTALQCVVLHILPLYCKVLDLVLIHRISKLWCAVFTGDYEPYIGRKLFCPSLHLYFF